MLIATSLAVVVLASALSGAAAPSTVLPPMTISVSASPSLSPTLVRYMLAEADAVWRGTGLSFVWRRERGGPDARVVDAQTRDAAPCLTPTLRVVIASGQPADARQRGETTMALGWITFEDGAPAPEIYLSYDNALAYMKAAREAVGSMDRMPVMETETLLARAMGRALAHELGHYLLASKIHTPRGLMRATHTATQFFAYDRTAFVIDGAQRQAVADRLRHDAQMAMHDPR